jgi:hypothetical protein
VFNVTNGDVFVWENVWPAIAEAAGMRAGDPAPFALTTLLETGDTDWDFIRTRHNLLAPSLCEFVGLSMEYADYQMRHGRTEIGPPAIVSTIKINQAGFHDTIDTETMFRKWFRVFQRTRLLPLPDHPIA